MSIGWLFLALALLWLALLGMVLLVIREPGDQYGAELELDWEWESLDGEPRLVSTCRELTELAAKVKGARHG